MKAISGNLDLGRVNLVFVAMIAVSLVIGIMGGYRSTIPLKRIFYIIVLTNALILAYLVLLKEMTYGLLLYLYALIFLNYYWRIPLAGKLPDLDVPRIVFMFFWVVFLLEVGLGKRRLLPKTGAEVAMLIVVVAIITSMIQYRVPRIRLLLNGFAIPYAMFMFSKHIFATRADINKFLYFGAVPMAVYFPLNNIFEALGMRQFVFPKYIVSPQIGAELGWAGERTMGAFLQPVATGFVVVAIFVMALYALSRLRGLFPVLLSVGICIVTPIGVFVTYTRSVYLGLFVALVILATFGKRLRKYALVMLLAVLLGVMANWENVTSEDRAQGGMATKTTAIGRLVLMETALRMFADHPFRGVGFDQYWAHRIEYVRQVRTTLLGLRASHQGKSVKQHNQLLLILSELGLSGFVPLCLMYYFIIRILWKARGVHGNAFDSEFVVAVSAAFAAYLSNAMFINPSFFEFMNVLPMILAGIVAGGYQRAMLGRWNNGNGERRSVGEGTIR